MDTRAVQVLLEQVKAGQVSVEDAVRRLGELPVHYVSDFAQLDGERALRMGVPEVIFGERKRPEQIGALVEKLVSLAKNNAIGLFGSADDVSLWFDIVEHHDLADDLEDPKDLPVGIQFIYV